MLLAPPSQSIYVLDLPGYGLSDDPLDFCLKSSNLTAIFEGYNDILEHVAQHILHVEKSSSSIEILAHSMGGPIAVNFVSKHPTLCSHLFLCNSAGLLPVMSTYGAFWAFPIKFEFPEKLLKTRWCANLCGAIRLAFGSSDPFVRFNMIYLFNTHGAGYALLSRHMHIQFTLANHFESHWFPCYTKELLEACNGK